jgi:hypothetical protein
VDVTDAAGAHHQILADSSGIYAVRGLVGGVYTLRFERAGYIPLSLDVRVPEHGAVHLDVTLDRAPPTMQTIKVVARDGLARIAARPDPLNAYRPWETDGDRMRQDPSLDFPEIVKMIGTSTFARVAPESAGEFISRAARPITRSYCSMGFRSTTPSTPATTPALWTPTPSPT